MTRDAAAIVAMADNGVIGRGNGLPWHLPGDLGRFKALTMGHALLMGRRTYDSIGRALPGRRNLVLTRNPDWQAPGCDAVTSLDSAVERARGATLFVIGGAEVFSLCWPIVGRLELVVLDVGRQPHGDARTAWPDDSRAAAVGRVVVVSGFGQPVVSPSVAAKNHSLQPAH